MPVKVALLTLVVAIPALLSGRVIWPPHAGNPMPTTAQLPLFLVLAAMEALALGLGVAYVAFGWPLMRRLTGGATALTWAMFVSIAWLLVSWWPHDNMHQANGHDLGGLLVIEYLYHATLMVAGAVLGYGFVKWLSSPDRAGTRPASDSPGRSSM
jgi:hypothetical protein